MTSQRRIEANRRNAQKSTGPRTPEGKAIVAQNAVRHGLLSSNLLIRGEDEADLSGFADRLRDHFAPIGELEQLLVDRIIAVAWRLRRLGHIEAALLDGKDQPADAFGHYGREKMAVLSRYEATLDRSFYAAMRELERLQEARRRTLAPAPLLEGETDDTTDGEAG